MLILSTPAFQVAKAQFQDQLEDLVSPICAVGAVGAIRPWAVVVLPSAALVLYTQLEISIKWGNNLDPTCEMLSRLSLSEEKEKLFRNWTEPFPELSFGPARLQFGIGKN